MRERGLLLNKRMRAQTALLHLRIPLYGSRSSREPWTERRGLRAGRRVFTQLTPLALQYSVCLVLVLVAVHGDGAAKWRKLL